MHPKMLKSERSWTHASKATACVALYRCSESVREHWYTIRKQSRERVSKAMAEGGGQTEEGAVGAGA